MKNISVASLNRFSEALATFPSVSVLTNNVIDRIEKSLASEKTCTLARACITLDYKVAIEKWETAVHTSENKLSLLKEKKAEEELIDKASEKHEKLLNSKPILNTCNYYVFGYIVQNFYGVTASCIVPDTAWKKAFLLRAKLYSDCDLGKHGKMKEVSKRLKLYTKNGQKKTVWSEFSAHKSGKKDIVDKVTGLNIESKTGVGDWYTSKRAKTLEGIRKELEKKENDRIEWDYTKIIRKEATKRKPARTFKLEIKYRKTWKEFFQILEGFNGDVGTWFKPIKTTENGYLLVMQEIQTSEKKMEYLMQFNDKL